MSNVTHPAHYNAGKIEVIEFLEDQTFGYHLGNSIKYICRAGRKDPAKEIEDLEKAAWYLNRKLELLRAKTENREATRPNAMNPAKTKRKPVSHVCSNDFDEKCDWEDEICDLHKEVARREPPLPGFGG